MKLGEVWNVDFSPQVGAEIKKIRPAIIVSHNAVGRLPLKVVVPVTDPTKTAQKWHVPLTPTNENGLTKDCIADCFQIKSVSNERFVEKLGELSEEDLSSVKVTLMTVLDLL